MAVVTHCELIELDLVLPRLQQVFQAFQPESERRFAPGEDTPHEWRRKVMHLLFGEGTGAADDPPPYVLDPADEALVQLIKISREAALTGVLAWLMVDMYAGDLYGLILKRQEELAERAQLVRAELRQLESEEGAA